MANFDLSFEKMLKLEFSSSKNALHKNATETGLTFMGIYETANPSWSGWAKIKSYLNMYNYYHYIDYLKTAENEVKRVQNSNKNQVLKNQIISELEPMIKEKKALCAEILEQVSQICFNDDDLKECVKDFYKKAYWDIAKLDLVLPFDTANLIFCFGVNVGMKKAIKYAQQVVKVENDGIVGKITLKALNSYSPLRFNKEYKELFLIYYKQLANGNPAKYGRYLQGWINRVKNT